jgi:hypothetical protein
VIGELQAGTFPNKEHALALLVDLPLVPVEAAIAEIVETYIQRMVMPRDPTGDALHLALARSLHHCIKTYNDFAFFSPPPSVKGGSRHSKVILDKASLTRSS